MPDSIMSKIIPPDPSCILRKDMFPLECRYCGKGHSEEDFLASITRYGLPYLDGGETIFQGFTCSECLKTTTFPFNRNEPLLDLRNFIIIPYFPYNTSLVEQYIERKRISDGNELLKFKHLPAWNEKEIQFEDICKDIESKRGSYKNDEYGLEINDLLYDNFLNELLGNEIQQSYIIPSHKLISNIIKDYTYNSTENDFYENNVYGCSLNGYANYLYNIENNSKQFVVRRLFPNNDFYHKLFILFQPGKFNKLIGKLTIDENWHYEWYHFSDDELKEKSNCVFMFLELFTRKSIKYSVIERFKKLKYNQYDNNHIDNSINNNIFDIFLYNYRTTIFSIINEFSYIDFLDRVIKWNGWEEILETLIQPVCSELAFSSKRKELIKWKDKIEEGKALFVDAPMGLGKTTSINDVIVEDINFSAVIFMPTNSMCRGLFNRLKNNLCQKYNLSDTDEIYYWEGINERECIHFKEITDKYKNNWLNKKDFCESCNKNKKCKFCNQTKKAINARIIIATHQQYFMFCENNKLHSWHRKDDGGKEVKRNAFIIDEDLLIAHCYKPIVLSYKESQNFITIVSNYIIENNRDKMGVSIKRTIDKINVLSSKIEKPESTAVICPVDTNFSFPDDIKYKWNESFKELPKYVPDYMEQPDTIGNYLNILEHGIRYGVVVHRYATKNSAVHNIYFPNPSAIDLSGLPPHVFFDGTMLSDKFIKKKLKNIQINRMVINIKPLWKLRVFQNINSDLPASTIEESKANVLKLLKDIFNELGFNKRYMIVTSKSIREKYLDKFFDDEFIRHFSFKPQTFHYGNFRGQNTGKDCRVCIMLGSFNPPDANEISMSLEFIQKKLKDKFILSTNPHLWTWGDSKGLRHYKDDFSVVGDMSKAIKHSEHRQGLARARYLSHETDFYIISKDLVSDYDPFLTEIETTQYRADLFRPRQERVDNKYEEVKGFFIEWLTKHESASASDIYNNYNVAKATVERYRDRLLSEGIIIPNGKKGFKLFKNG